LKAYRNLYRGHAQRFELSKCNKTHPVLPRIVIRNCFDLFFRFLLYDTSTVTPTPKSNEHVQIHDTFHARGIVVSNTATTSAPAFEIKMATFTGAERARCVFWFEETKSVTQVQRNFRTKYRKEPPSRPKLYSWHTNFVQTGCSVRHAKSPGRPCVSDATVEQLRESFVRRPRKSTRLASRETGIPNVTVW